MERTREYGQKIGYRGMRCSAHMDAWWRTLPGMCPRLLTHPQQHGTCTGFRRSSCRLMSKLSPVYPYAPEISLIFCVGTLRKMDNFLSNRHTICWWLRDSAGRLGWMAPLAPRALELRRSGNRCGRHKCQGKFACFYGGSQSNLYRPKMFVLIDTCLTLRLAVFVGPRTRGVTRYWNVPLLGALGL